MLVIPKLVAPGSEAAEAAWQQEGRRLLAADIGAGSFSWARFCAAAPNVAAPGAKPWSHETTCIVFHSREDLDRWRSSPSRQEWVRQAPTQVLQIHSVELGEEFLTKWLQSSTVEAETAAAAAASATASVPPAPPPQSAWTTVPVVLVALYPMVLLNGALVPALEAALPAFAALPHALQVLASLCWTVPYVVLLGVPATRRALSAAGLFSEGARRAGGAAVAALLVAAPAGAAALAAP